MVKSNTINKTEEKKEVQMPIDKLHYSMLTQLLRNPLIFKLKYILGVYNSKSGVSGMIGRAGHEALKVYYGGNPDVPTPADKNEARELAIDHGMRYLEEYPDAGIRYGKTGTRETMLAAYTRAMNFYFLEEPEYNNLIMVEEKMDAEIESKDGMKMPLPAVGVPDLVNTCEDGTTDIIDTKFVKTFTKYEDEDGDPFEDYIKIVQAKFLGRLLKKVKGIVAKRVVFREIKYSENRGENEGKPQIRDYVIPLDHEPYDVIFDNLYIDVVKFLSNPNAIYLPNLSDPYDGEQSGLLYAQGLLTADMSDVEVMHKVRDVALVSKKFVPSRLDRVENSHLDPEEKIKLRMAEFGIPMQPVEKKEGANVTQYRFKVSAGIRMSTIEKHKADIARALEAKGDVRILAPIPGTSLVGVEVSNETRTKVKLDKEHLTPGTLMIPIGVTVQGEVIKALLNEMPHLLIAGAAGSGKSVTLHSVITALTKQLKQDKMQMILIDPKRVELVAFAKLPHLKGGKIIYEYESALIVMKGLIEEMELRYKMLEETKNRDIGEYNSKQEKTMPYIVTVIDEFADLILQGKMKERSKKRQQSLQSAARRIEVEQLARQFAKMGMTYKPQMADDDEATAEELMTRLAQMGRAAGIHLIIATQRPSVDVITGLIKANFPTRIALTTASPIDSKIIIGEEGAERLNGKGDMIFMSPGIQGRVRLQGFITE